ncbi:MAG: hypothetical protein K6A65_00790 [Succinivibrionaceae bacterium]|nr:hypothetical protein [Succinivibrionaceae bacterium]
MDMGLQLVLGIELLVFTIPLDLARYLLFRDELRCRPALLAGAYALLVALMLAASALGNYGSPWPLTGDLGVAKAVLLVCTNLLLFAAIRPLWSHLLVLGILLSLWCAIALPTIWAMRTLFPSEQLIRHLLITTMGGLVLSLWFMPALRLITAHRRELRQRSCKPLWKVLCLLPLCGFAMESALSMAVQVPAYAALAALLWAAALLSTLAMLRRMLTPDHDGPIPQESKALLDELSKVEFQHVKIRQRLFAMSRERGLRLQALGNALASKVEQGQWQDLEREIQGRAAAALGSGEQACK